MADTFLSEVEILGRALMKEAKGKDIDVRDKIAIFSNAVKFAAVKNKLEPDGGEEGDGWNKYRNGAGGKSGEHTAKESSVAAAPARSTHRPADDTTAATAAAEKERSYRTTNLGNDDGSFQNPSPPSGSFPVNGGGIHTGNNGSEPA